MKRRILDPFSLYGYGQKHVGISSHTREFSKYWRLRQRKAPKVNSGLFFKSNYQIENKTKLKEDRECLHVSDKDPIGTGSWTDFSVEKTALWRAESRGVINRTETKSEMNENT